MKVIMMPYSIYVAQVAVFKPASKNEINPKGA
jgi:hypothetical protein